MLNIEELPVAPTVQGLVPILATPFHPDGSLDLPSLRRLTGFQLASGVDGVAVLGMASEAFALTATERHRHERGRRGGGGTGPAGGRCRRDLDGDGGGTGPGGSRGRS